MPLPQKLQVASSAGKSAGVNAWKASGNLVDAVGRLVDKAIDRVLLTNERVTSAAEGRRLLAGDADTDALAGEIQRVVVLAMPVVRILARRARLTRKWVVRGAFGRRNRSKRALRALDAAERLDTAALAALSTRWSGGG